MKEVVVLIPCYNEEMTVGKVVADFKSQLPEARIYVFDNNSKDKTAEIAQAAGAIVVSEFRQGKGNVVRSMFRHIEADVYLMVDGDDTYPAEFAKSLIQPVLEGNIDMVIGDRLSNGSYADENKRLFHGFGNSLVRNVINVLLRASVNDVMTCYRAFSKEFVQTVPLLSRGFEVETEMTLQALDKNFRILEIPIAYRDRPMGSESKLNTVTDGFRVLGTILKLFKDYRPFTFFSFISALFLILSLVVGVPVVLEFLKTGQVSKVPSAILSVGLAIFFALFFIGGLILDTVSKLHRELSEQVAKGQLRYSNKP
jgi:glycosyltransferase involved in cell wall biosynthesis